MNQREGGFTLVELLVAMPIAMLMLALTIQALGRASHDQQDIERRTQMQTDAQIGLERMTAELRQATWVYFRSSSVIDMNVRVRATASANGVYRLVRYDCSGDTCVRSEGPPTSYPPVAAPTFIRSEDVIGADADDTGARRGFIVAHDVFRPTRIDPATGASVPDFVSPDFVFIRLQLEIKQLHSATRQNRRVLIEDGVSLRNVTDFAA